MATRSSSSLFIVLLLTSALFVSISTITLPVPVRAAAPGTLNPLSPATGPPTAPGFPGTVVTVTGSGWGLPGGYASGTTCTLSGSPGLVTASSCAIGAGGTLVGGFTVGSLAGGSYSVYASVGSDALSVAQTFTVVAGISLSPIQGPPSIHVTISGGGYSSSGSCSPIITFPVNIVRAGSDVCTVIGTAKTIAVGSGFDVDPTAAAGVYTVFANILPTDTPSATFTVVTGPSVVVAPSSGAHGLTVTVSGTGFSLSDTSATMGFTKIAGGGGGALWSGTIIPTLTVAGPFKVASATFTVASSVVGPFPVTYRISIQGSTGDFGDTTAVGDFQVVADPTIMLVGRAGNPVGPAGQVVTVTTTTAFSSTDAGVCTISSTAPTSKLIPAGSAYICQIDAAGNLVGSMFVVPSNAPGGSYSLKVTGGKGDSATTGFLVEPAATLDQTSGYPPITTIVTAATRVKVTGTGFSSLDTSCGITGGTGLLIDTSGETCTVDVSTGQLTAYFKVKKDSYFTGVAVTVTVKGLPGNDQPPVGTEPTFMVLARIVVSPTSQSPGGFVDYAGSGFTNTVNVPPDTCLAAGGMGDISGSPVNTLGPPPPLPTCNQDVGGNVWGRFYVKTGFGSGTFSITYTDASGVAPIASTPLIVTGGPVVSLSQYSGPTGTTVTVTGSGFNSADVNVQITNPSAPFLFSPSIITCSVSGGTIASGCTFTVKSNAPGVLLGYTLSFTGDKGDTSATNFLVTSTFKVNPTSGGGATSVTASGSGYVPGLASINCWPPVAVPGPPFGLFPAVTLIDGAAVGSCTIDTSGVLTASFSIVAAPAVGAHTVGINDPALAVQGTATDTFTVTQPILVFTPDTGTGGDTIQFTGTSFSSGDTLFTLTTFAAPPPLPNPIQTYTYSVSSGTVSGSFKVLRAGDPTQVATLMLKGSLGDFATASFSVVPQISHTLTPGGSTANPARVGSTVTVTGSNFDPADVAGGVLVTSAGGSVAPTACTVGSDFTMNCAVVVSLTYAGLTDVITATGSAYPGNALDIATAILYLMPHVVTLTPSHGPTGASISVTATGFTLTDFCGLGGSVLDASPAVGAGTWVCSVPSGGTITGSFVVGAVAPGTSTLTLTGSDGDIGTATFILDPGMSLLPNSGRPATTVLISGTNFALGDTGCSISSTPSGLISGPLCTVAGGAMSGSFTVAAGTVGDYTVNVAGTTGDTGHATFHVPAGPSLFLAPNPANTGSVVTASGTDYLGTTCLLTSSPSNLFSASPSCSIAAGTLAASFTVASGASGSYTVNVATNAGSGDSATSDLSITAGPVPTLALTPITGPTGTVVTGTGTGFTADVTCILTAAPSAVLASSSCTVTGGGGFTVGFTVPSGAAPGTYALIATGNTGKAASASFTVVSGGARTFSLTPTSGRIGTVVTASGANFAGTTCQLSSSPSGLLSAQSCSLSGGTLTGGFTAASGAAAGGYTVTVTTDVPGDTVSASFTVPGATLTLSPSTGSAGTVVTATGSNYAGGTCTLTSTPTGLFTGQVCAISASGALTGGFTVTSDAPSDTYTVTATTPSESSFATFTVPRPSLTISPSSGAVGTAVSISGTNFVGSTCSISSSPSGLISSPTCLITNGNLDGGFIIATGAVSGGYTVTVTPDLFGATSASATFTVPTGVRPTLTLSPTSGATGTAVSVSGSGYSGTTCTLSASGLFGSAACTISGGRLSGGFTVASNAADGSYTVTVTTDVSTDTTSAIFSVTKKTTPYCIIATTTFGSEASPAVQLLRTFRDGLALNTRAGSAFMTVFNAWYYSFSPTVAGFIASHDPIRAPMKVIIYPLLGILSASTLAYSIFSWTPEFGILMAGLVASSLIGLVYLTPFMLVSMRSLTRRKRINTISIAKASLLVLATGLGLLAAGELAGSFLILAVASSAIVLTCIIAAPTIVALLVLRPKSQ